MVVGGSKVGERLISRGSSGKIPLEEAVQANQTYGASGVSWHGMWSVRGSPRVLGDRCQSETNHQQREGLLSCTLNTTFAAKKYPETRGRGRRGRGEGDMRKKGI